jgi:hypothetical protein
MQRLALSALRSLRQAALPSVCLEEGTGRLYKTIYDICNVSRFEWAQEQRLVKVRPFSPRTNLVSHPCISQQKSVQMFPAKYSTAMSQELRVSLLRRGAIRVTSWRSNVHVSQMRIPKHES